MAGYIGGKAVNLSTSGADISGTVTADGLTVSGDAVFTPDNDGVRITGANYATLRLEENDTTDVNTSIFNSGGDFVITTSSDDRSSTTDRIRLDHATGDISFYEDTGTTPKFFWDASAESLGIGTTSPTALVDISKSGTGDYSTFRLSNTGASGRKYELGLGGNTAAADYANKLYFRDSTAGSNRMVIDSSGRVGIGTSSPAFPLDLSTNSSTTNDAVVVARISANTTGTAANNFGAALNFSGEDASGSLRDLATINAIYTNATNRSSALTFKTRENLGALTERMRIDSSGSVGIGTDSPSESLTNRGNILIETNSTSADSGNGLFWQSTTSGWSTSTAHAAIYGKRTDASNGYLRFDTRQSGTTQEAMRIDSSGNVLVGTTDTTLYNNSTGTGTKLGGDGRLDVSRSADTVATFNRTGSSDGEVIRIVSSGTTVGNITVSGSNTAYNTSSDYRLKENVDYTWDATTRLKQLKPARFNFISDADTLSSLAPNVTVDGVLAHDAQAVVPESVTGTHNEVDYEGNAVMQGIDQSKLVPLLVKTIQELEARITALENA